MHFLHYIIRPELARCHLIFNLDSGCDKHKHYFYCPAAIKVKWFPNDNLYIGGSIFSIIEKVGAEVVLMSDYKVDLTVLEKLSKIVKLWFFNHGIWCPGILERRKSKNSQYPHLDCFHKIFITENESRYLPLKLKNKIVVVKGYIGLDLLNWYQREKMVDNLQRSILIITNKAGFQDNVICNDAFTLKEYNDIIEIVCPWALKHGYVVKSKMKNTRHLAKQVAKNKQVVIIGGDDLIYKHLLAADMVIVQGYSSCFIESLVLNKPCILCQLPKGADFLGLESYPNLLQAYNQTDLLKCLNLVGGVGGEFVNNSLYQSDRVRYLNKYLGTVVGESLMSRVLQEAG